MKRPARYWLTILWCLPAALISWLAVLLMFLLFGNKLHWMNGLWMEFRQGSWPMRSWYKGWAGTTFVLGGIYAPGRAGDLEVVDTRTERHEHVHIEQGEAACLVGLAIAVAIFLWFGLVCGLVFDAALFGLVVWTTAPIVNYLGSVFQAWIRGEKPYRGSHLEEAAYSQDD